MAHNTESSFLLLSSSPLDQFEVTYFLGEIFSNFSYAAMFTILGVVIIFLAPLATANARFNVWQQYIFDFTTFCYGLVKDQIGLNSREYFGLISTIFLSVLVFNLLGLIPYSFTITSHLAITLAFSTPIFVAMTGEALYRHKLDFFSLFLPQGTPIPLIPILVAIELISYISRLFSLAIRLGANLIAGHVILKIIAGAAANALQLSVAAAVAVVVPILLVITVFSGLELLIGCLQAYVLAMLCANYLNDGINLH